MYVGVVRMLRHAANEQTFFHEAFWHKSFKELTGERRNMRTLP